MILSSFALIVFLLMDSITASTRSLNDICELLKINNPVACKENKISSFTLNEYQRITRFLESEEDKINNTNLLEELYYYHGLKLSLDLSGDKELDAISQWEKITETNYLVKLKENKLDELYLKFGELDNLKTESHKQMVANFDTLDLDSKLEICPYSYELLVTKNRVLWEELKKASESRTNNEAEEDLLIIVATELSSNYLTILNKFKKSLTLDEKSKFFSALADIEFLILNNFKKSQLFAKNCLEFDDLNAHCMSLIKLSNKIIKSKNSSPGDLPFDLLELNKNVNTKWANAFIKMNNDKKGKNTFTALNKQLIEHYSSQEDLPFKYIMKNSPYSDLLHTWIIISSDLTSTHKNLLVGKKKMKNILNIIKYDELKNGADVINNLTEDLLAKIWNNKSPYLCLNVIKYLLESKEFQTQQSKADIKILAKFLESKELFQRNENELDHFTNRVVSEVKQGLEEQQMHERKIREQQQQQFFQQQFQQQNGHHNHFNRFGGQNQQFHHQQQQQQQPQHPQFSKEKDYYKVLQVDEHASTKEIRKSYLNLIKQYHPDKLSNLSEKEKVKMESLVHSINEAYEILYDDNTRNEYDSFRTGRW